MRRLLQAAGILVMLTLVTLAAIYVVLRRSLPVVDGTIAAAGLTAPIDIVRDADDIPHVFAANKHDAFFGLGYVHAQDRLWQMEFQRRIGFGRLSEIFGSATVPQDQFLRTVGFGRAARAAWDAMPAWAREQVNAYVAGINAFISTHHGTQLPPEFQLLRFEPEPWTGPDVAVWVKMMAWDLSANYAFELLRHDLALVVGPERMPQLLPPYPVNGLSITGPQDVEDESAAAASGKASNAPVRPFRPRQPVLPILPSFERALSSGEPAVADILFGGATQEALGSNNWVVDGTLSRSGKPLLANDPHLDSHLPSTWYLAHVVGGDFEIIGGTLPGTPAVALGRNRYIAWGATNVAADVEDLYRERFDDTGRFAEFRGAREPVTIIPETINVKGGSPVHVDVRITRHGPVVSDAINAVNAASKREPKAPPIEPLAFRWTALDPTDGTLVSFLKLNEARNWEQFTSALRDYVVPSQNFIYADIDGHIGYYAPGRIPVRASGDGSQPADGWTGDAEWTGWVPFDELPHLYDPPGHFIVTANHRPAPAEYPHMLGLEWVEPYRASRIVELLRTQLKFGPDDFARIQADTVSLHAKALLPILLTRVHPATDSDRQAATMLRQWDGNASPDSAASAIFQAWFVHLTPLMVGDELGAVALRSYASRFTYITRFLIDSLTTTRTEWCDDVRTKQRESCSDVVTQALHEAVVDLTQRLGGDMKRWRWDAVHRVTFPHQGLDSVSTLRPLLSRSLPHGGDWSTVNVGPVAADAPYEQHTVPGYREIIDLSPANDSRYQIDIGESGHFLSKHYDDYLADWQAVRHKKMRMTRADVENGAIGHLRLRP